MGSCCRAGACEQMFDARVARRSLRRYRKKGLDDLERRMLASVRTDARPGERVLEIGGGIGTIQAELIENGAERGEIVELVSAYGPYARELAEEKGIADRVTFRVADLLEDRMAAAPADVVVLNRVVCCSPDGVALTGLGAQLTKRALVLSFPRDRMLVRAGTRLVNLWLRMVGRSFRVFFHRPAALEAAAEAEGLRVFDRGRGRLWEFAALQRL